MATTPLVTGIPGTDQSRLKWRHFLVRNHPCMEITVKTFLELNIAKREPGVFFSSCIRSFTDAELLYEIDVDQNLETVDIGLHSMHDKYVWSQKRVYFIYDEDGKQFLRSVPRNQI
jgi:hypothetical protein